MNEELHSLLNSITQLNKKLSHALPIIHDTAASELQLSIIRHLATQDKQTVPQIAAARQSSRQNIQVVINELLSLGIVTKSINPKHKKSLNYELSTIGREIFKSYDANYQKFLSELSSVITTDEIKQTLLSVDKINKFL
jgi:DNA-binding MarR family transcriptional regulator